MANVLLFAFDFCFRFRVTSTGHGALRTTRSAVLPSRRCFRPLWPRVESAIRSALISRAKLMICSYRSAGANVAILRTKCRYMFAMNTGQFLVQPFDRLC